MSRRAEISAGILVYRRNPRIEVLLAHPGGPYWRKKDDNAWSIPKGIVNPAISSHARNVNLMKRQASLPQGRFLRSRRYVKRAEKRCTLLRSRPIST